MRALHYVVMGVGYVFAFVALAVASVPGVFAFLFLSLGDLMWKPSIVEPERVKPDYESDWKVVIEEWDTDVVRPGDVSIYRNGSRYTTQGSLQGLKYSGTGAYFDVIPPEVRHELELKLKLTDFIREWEQARLAGSRVWLDRLALVSVEALEGCDLDRPLERKLDLLVKRYQEGRAA